MKKIILILLAISILVSGCSSNLNAKEQILYNCTYDFTTLDPQVDLNLDVGFFAMHIFDRLVEYDINGKIYPSLLKSMPDISEDGKLYKFELKPDIRFANGDKLTSKDVKFTFERMLLPETGAKSIWILDTVKGAKDMLSGKEAELSGFKIINDQKFELQLEKPYVMFIQGLTTPYASIFPEEACKRSGVNWARAPIGTGPFKLYKWEEHKEIVLEKYNDYFGEKPHLDKIVNKIYQDNWDFSKTQVDYDLGKLDTMVIPPEKYKEFKNDPKYKDNLYVLEALNTRYITLNNQNPILKDPKVRQAIWIAIDRKKICDNVLKESSVPAYTILPQKIDGYDKNAYIEYNPEKAKVLLKEAGYPNGFSIDFYLLNKNYLNVEYSIQIMLDQVGIHLNPLDVTEDEFVNAKKTGKITMCLSNWCADIPDADNFLYNLFYSKLNRTSRYNNPEFDKQCDYARVIFDMEKRKELYKKLDRLICQEDWVTIPLFHDLEIVLNKSYLKHAFINPITNLPDFRQAYKE